MGRKIERPDDCRRAGTQEGKGKQNSVTPLLIDSTYGAEILGVSQPGFHRFMAKNKTIRPVTIGTLLLWRRDDLRRLIGKPREPQPAEDILIDALTVATLCSISRSMVYKLNDLGMMPNPIMVGERLRWSSEEIGEWVAAGCPNTGRRTQRATKKVTRTGAKRKGKKK